MNSLLLTRIGIAQQSIEQLEVKAQAHERIASGQLEHAADTRQRVEGWKHRQAFWLSALDSIDLPLGDTL
jgi:hypothetical protein